MKIQMAKGLNVFRALREERERRQRSRERCKAMGITGPADPRLLEKIKLTDAPTPAPKRATGQAGRPLSSAETAKLLRELISALAQEFAPAMSRGGRMVELSTDRVHAFAARFVANHRFEFVRKS